jgi:hypothetical protein
MRHLVGPIAAIILMSSGTYSGALVYPNDLAKWVVVETPDPPRLTSSFELSDARLAAACADPDHEWRVFLRAGRPSARLKSEKDPVPPPLPFEIKKGTAAEGLLGDRLNVKVDDGWIVSFNAGE